MNEPLLLPLPRAARRPRTRLLHEVLARWGLPTQLPAGRFDRLEMIFAAHLRHVPFENLTKLVRGAAAPRPSAGRRTPDIFWREHLEMGSGGTCFAATAAFQALADAVGLPATPVFCHLPAEQQRAHVALLVDTERGPCLADPGYALAAPVPLPKRGAVRRRTPHYDLELRRGIAGEYLVFCEDDRGRRFRYRFRAEAARPGEFLRAWTATLRPGAWYMTRIALGRFGETNRRLYQHPGAVATITRTGQETKPLAEPRSRALAEAFQLPESLVRLALERLPAADGGMMGTSPGRQGGHP